MKRRLVALIIIVIVGLATGFWFGRNKAPAMSDVILIHPPIAHSQPSRYAMNEDKSAAERTLKNRAKLNTFRKVSDYPTRYALVSPLFREWAQDDPVAAFEAAMEYPEAQGMGVLYPIMSVMTRQEGFQPSLERIEATPEGPMRAEAFRYLAQEIFAVDDKVAAMELLLDRVPVIAKASALDAGILSWRMKSSHEEVWKWIEAKLAEGKIEASALPEMERSVSALWIDQSPEKAAAWLRARATDASLPGHLAIVAERWGRAAPNAAAKWLESLPPGPQNDAALASFSTQICRDDPESAAHWAVRISDASKRTQALGIVIPVWQQRAPEAAARFQAAHQSNAAH